MNSNKQRIVWLAMAAMLSFLIGGRWNVAVAAWISPILLIRFFRTSTRPWRDTALAWLSTTIPVLIAWHGATAMSFIHPAAEVLFFVAIGPIGLIPYLVDRAYWRRYGSPMWLTFVFPIATTAVDFLSSSGSPVGTFGASGYSQRDALPVMQLAALTGLWGIGFVISWCASFVNMLWERRFQPSRSALVGLCCLALLLGLGYARILTAPQPKFHAQIAGFSLAKGRLAELLQQAQAGDQVAFREAVQRLHRQELNQIQALAIQGAQIIVLQEGAGIGFADQVQQLIADTAAIAKQEQVYIVLPTYTLGATPPINRVQIIDPDGKIALAHVKYGGNQFEGSLKGDGIIRVVDTPYGRLSAVICWDADFPTILKQAGAQQVDMLFIPSNDWLEVKDIHAGMATFRAVENGMAIFRQTGQGVSVVADAYGRQVARIDLFEQPGTAEAAAVQQVRVQVGAVPTLYPVIGDLVGMVAQLGMLGLLAWLGVLRAWPSKRMRISSEPGV